MRRGSPFHIFAVRCGGSHVVFRGVFFLPLSFLELRGVVASGRGGGGVLDSSSTKKHVLFVEDARGDY